MAQVALAWVLRNPVVAAPIVGADQAAPPRRRGRRPRPRASPTTRRGGGEPVSPAGCVLDRLSLLAGSRDWRDTESQWALPSSVRPTLRLAGAPASPQPVVVFLHGYGSDERDLAGLAQYLPAGLPWVSVRAPLRHPSFNYAWYPLDDIGSEFDSPAIEIATAALLGVGRWRALSRRAAHPCRVLPGRPHGEPAAPNATGARGGRGDP